MTAYPPPPDTGSWQSAPDHPAGVPSEDRNWAMLAHLGSLISAWFALGLFAPLIVLLVKGGISPYVRRHAVESLNFQINAFVYTVVFTVLLFVLVGFVLLPVYAVFYLFCVVLATMRASGGEEYRYPLTLRFVS